MKICSNCILPETFPGISFNTHGICNHCQEFDNKKERLADEKKRYRQKFLNLLDQLIQSDQLSKRSYDILMAYSGGKDSTYIMSLFKNQYKLRILAVSFDNGFISDTALSNIKKVTNRLDIDHIFFKPRWEVLRKIFIAAAEKELYPPKTLERASTICTSCMGIVKSLCLKIAIEMDIPLVGYGWSPGQAPIQSSIMKNNPSLLRMSQQVILNPLREIVGDEIKAYFLHEKHYLNHEFPYNIHPMAWEFYDEDVILKEIQKIGWIAPTDTDSNSTNCLLNAFANRVHLQKYGFHPYVWEIANMVRRGDMSRENGYTKIYTNQDNKQVEYARRILESQ
ncbi:MAG: hypothetical protein OEW69_05590 [Nitrospirota bacterium]|nr:hypothetical protein [Nitrospirota bacterium]